MVKLLFLLVWPVGMAVIFGTAMLLDRRVSRLPEPGAARTTRQPRRHGAPGGERSRALPGWAADATRFVAIVIAGSVLVLLITWLLGLVVLHIGPPIDKPFYAWAQTHREHLWKILMTRATKIGDSQATWAAALTAGACLAVAWRRMRWLPPLALVLLVVGQKVVVHLVHHLVHRAGPPISPHGVFPSGGAARALLFYGLIAYLLWREFGGTRRTAIWASTAVAAIAFNEGYSRAYLSLHWLTDILSGWLYGGMLLVVYILAVRFVAGPARAPTAAAGVSSAPAAGARATGAAPGRYAAQSPSSASAEGPVSAPRRPSSPTPSPAPAPPPFPESYA